MLILLCLVLLGASASASISSEFVDPDTPHTIVYPVRVDKLGRQLDKSSSAHRTLNARRKRETLIESYDYEELDRDEIDDHFSSELPSENISSDTEDTEEGKEIFVKIDNDGDELLLQLRPNSNLRLQGTVVEWVLPSGATILKTAPENCFLVGTTVGKERSLVAVSSCSGFTGLIQSGQNSYFIEPLYSRHKHPKYQPPTNSHSSGNRRQPMYQQSRFNASDPFDEMSNDDDHGRIQEQSGDISTITLPEPHVMYNVNSVLKHLNISLQEDQKFGWDPLKKGGRRRHKRSSRSSRATLSGAIKPKKEKGFVRKATAAAHKGKASEKKTDRNKRRKKRNRRHNKRTREMRQRCRELKAGIFPDEKNGNMTVADLFIKNGTDNEDDDTDMIELELNTENLEVWCALEEERRAKKRLQKEERKIAREIKLKEREMKKQAREERKRLRQERKTRKKEQQALPFEQDLFSGSALGPWSSLNGSEWHGGYSPDLPWEVALPGHSPSVVEEDLRSLDTSPALSSPKRWLEITVAVDSSIIDFHGEDRTEQYVFTLFNIVSAIYQDPSLGAKLELVLLRLICYTDPKQSQVRAGEAKSSLEAVNRWASRLHHASQPPLRHDLAVWLTRLPLGGPSGYAPVGGVCHPSRSCTLNRDEGLTSAFIIAHEMGHVLGLSHDGDSSSSNACVSEGVMGSVMAPLVAATFTNFHWSRCSRTEYLDLVNSWECLKTPPSWVNATTVSSVISYHYSLDDQCRMEFGEGYELCRSYGLSDSCTHLWCANSSTPHFCKTKKGPPLEGTVCGEGKWCRFGVCSSRSTNIDARDSALGVSSSITGGEIPDSSASTPVRHNPQHGGWSPWSDWGPCSVTCGPGVSFRSRTCDRPTPQWGGRSCRGKKEEWKVCGSRACSALSDVRADHCSQLSNLVELDQRMSLLHWLPYEPKSKRLKCRVSCYSRATNEMYLGHESLRDGAPCSYDSPRHHICVQGKCVELGCDLQLGSAKREDVCGQCEGDGGSCFPHAESFQGTPGPSYSLVTVLPVGARHISVSEEEGTPNFLALAQLGNHSVAAMLDFSISEEAILLNPDHRVGPARSLVNEGALFHYSHRGEKESISARGPLLYEVAVLIHGGDVEMPVHVTSSYYSPDPPNNYRWVAGPLSACSTTCGGGVQRPTLECVNAATGALASHERCERLPAPLVQALPCNIFSCNVMWSPGAWEHCSATCGTAGVQERVVSCVAVEEPGVPIDPHYCPADLQPAHSQPCNREPCTANWNFDGWSKCEGICGSEGIQEALWRCSRDTHESENEIDVAETQSKSSSIDDRINCGPYPPKETSACIVQCENSTSECEDREIMDVQEGDETLLLSLSSNTLDHRESGRLKTSRCNTEKLDGDLEAGKPNAENGFESTAKDPWSRNSFLVRRKQFPFDSKNSTRYSHPAVNDFPSLTCKKDVSPLCDLPSLRKYCMLRGYKKLCCATCA